ncbi:hypothetical protein L484_002586 [Morus notabilis]|uniref:Uncharacterized protein n=1 Tax=Morus notabilis TaxID=981085 RepID=W9S7E8_9ROSA|nr:hypothetical protein L484_002586 [Morus notabilis]
MIEKTQTKKPSRTGREKAEDTLPKNHQKAKKFWCGDVCRAAVLPVLEKLVASSRKPTALTEARKSVEEAMQSWRASSNDLQCMRQILVSKVEETFKSSNDHRALDEVDRLSKLVAAKLKEVKNDNKLFNEMKRLQLKWANSPWCSFP